MAAAAAAAAAAVGGGGGGGRRRRRWEAAAVVGGGGGGGRRRRRNPQLIDDFVACPAFLYGFQTALKQLQAIFPIPWIRCGARGSFEINALNAMRSRLRSEDRLLLITGGRLCLKLAERLLCFNGECAVRYALRLGASVLSRRHFFRNSSALCGDSEGAQELCLVYCVSPYGAASGIRQQ